MSNVYIYNINPDNQVATMWWSPTTSLPEGYALVPEEFQPGGPLFYVDGELTDIAPEVPYDDTEDKIKMKIREMAIAELIKDGELPPDFEDKEK